MAPCGAIPVSALVLVAMLYHDPVVTMMVPIAIVMPIVIPVVMVTAALDHNLFGVGNRRRRDGDRDRKSTRLNSSHAIPSRMPSSA